MVNTNTGKRPVPGPTWPGALHHHKFWVMRVPRRTPFYAPASEELAYVHDLFYADPSNTESVQTALQIVRLWMNRATCPQAIEVTALLAQAQLLDLALGAHEASRAAYAMSIVRFVNSIVDAFQTGLYAQSIGAIAERIGLPQWLVQVRHSATHEELPSLVVCRDACAMSLQWLDAHYWQPTLQPAPVEDLDEDDDDTARRDAAAAAAQLLHTYRLQAIALARDRSLALRGSPPLVKTMAELEQWVQTETARRLASASEHGQAPLLAGGAPRPDEYEVNDTALLCTASTLMLLATQLLLPGALIPASKERTLAMRTDAPFEALAEEHLELWDPLIRALHAAFPIFLPVLIQALAHIAAGGEKAKEQSYAAVARAWLAHLSLDAPYDTMQATLDVPRWQQPPTATHIPAAPEDADAVPLWEPTQSTAPLRRLVIQYALETRAEPAWSLAQHLSDGELAERVEALIALHRVDPSKVDPPSLDEMEMRSRLLRGLEPRPAPVLTGDAEPETSALEGWRRPANWQPTPIGCLDGQRPPLTI